MNTWEPAVLLLRTFKSEVIAGVLRTETSAVWKQHSQILQGPVRFSTFTYDDRLLRAKSISVSSYEVWRVCER